MKQTEDLFVSYEIAKQLKDKGFNQPCFGYYGLNNVLDFIYNCNNQMKDYVSAPIYQQVCDWFREKHGTHLSVSSYGSNESQLYQYNGWYNVPKNGYCGDKENPHYNLITGNEKIETYYEALTKAIEEALRLI